MTRPKRFGLALACGFILSVSLAVTLEAQSRGKVQKLRKNSVLPEMKASEVPADRRQVAPQAVAFLDDSRFDVGVDPDLALTPIQLALYEDMALQIGDFTGTPNARTNFFSGIGYTIVGWEGIAREVAVITDGYRVTVSVVPEIVSDEDIPSSVSSDYLERFDVINDVVTYVDSLDPLGQSGGALPVFEY